MFRPYSALRIYLALGRTDMRKAINGLSILVEEHLDLDPFSGCLFVFCNARRNILKILYWDVNGFCLWQKRLEKHMFKWPVSPEEAKEISSRELNWLIEGLDITRVKGHDRLDYSTLI